MVHRYSDIPDIWYRQRSEAEDILTGYLDDVPAGGPGTGWDHIMAGLQTVSAGSDG